MTSYRQKKSAAKYFRVLFAALSVYDQMLITAPDQTAG
jgi:hypothetical protein